jgi:hypothetical protein
LLGNLDGFAAVSKEVIIFVILELVQDIYHGRPRYKSLTKNPRACLTHLDGTRMHRARADLAQCLRKVAVPLKLDLEPLGCVGEF